MSAIAGHQILFRRVFLGSGNALAADQDTLLDVHNFLMDDLGSIERTSVYGRASSINEKGAQKLKQLREAGLGMIYWGAESGSDSVLKYLNKGCTVDEMLAAADIAHEAGVSLSMMFMPGGLWEAYGVARDWIIRQIRGGGKESTRKGVTLDVP